MSRLWITCGALALACLAPAASSAHFLWLVTDAATSPPRAKVYFGETADPDDPALLDRVRSAEAWALDRRGEAQALALKKGEDALVAELPASARNATLILRHTYGVLSRGGGEPFLLNYYSKAYPSPLPGAWRPVDDAERLPLEITPRVEKDGVALRVTWKGKPAPGATVTIHGPGIDTEGDTDDKGIFRSEFAERGLYHIRARLIENAAGEHEGKTYREARHYTTLALEFAPVQLTPIAHDLPELPQPATSIGAAIAGDAVYVYGGNYGDAHEYSRAGQSGDLWKLNLTNPKQWEKVSSGPKLQGLAMVAHEGRLYRVGGFTAMNEEDEEQDLRSQADFARFDPQTKQWESLPSLPEPRSSHDAAVLDGVLYVVGGWSLQGESGERTWHDSAVAVDLGAENLEWKRLASPPFRRRALAVAAWNGKLYCLGGMQEDGGPTTAVAVYDPQKDAWSEGPALLGGAMDGFGASAFACGDSLYATTITGSIQRLSGKGKEWEYVGQLDHPRFFHRLLPLDEKRLIVVGGGSMSVGKIPEVEIVPTK